MNFRFDFQFNVHRAAPRVSDSSSAAFQGTWSMTYTNGSAYLPPRCLRFLRGSECIFRPPSPNFTNRIHFRCHYNSSNILCKGIFRYVDFDWNTFFVFTGGAVPRLYQLLGGEGRPPPPFNPFPLLPQKRAGGRRRRISRRHCGKINVLRHSMISMIVMLIMLIMPTTYKSGSQNLFQLPKQPP